MKGKQNVRNFRLDASGTGLPFGVRGKDYRDNDTVLKNLHDGKGAEAQGGRARTARMHDMGTCYFNDYRNARR